MKKKDKKNKKGSAPGLSARDIEEQASEIMKSRDVSELDHVEIPEDLRSRLSVAETSELDKLEKEFGSITDRERAGVEAVKEERQETVRSVEEEPLLEPEETRVDGSCSISISEDGMSALVSLHPSLHGGEPLTFEGVMKEASSAGVVHGVNADLLKKLIMTVEKTKEEKQGVMFAKGTPPEEGHDGRVEYHFGEDDAVLPPPEEGDQER
jgi:hypothetical protein